MTGRSADYELLHRQIAEGYPDWAYRYLREHSPFLSLSKEEAYELANLCETQEELAKRRLDMGNLLGTGRVVMRFGVFVLLAVVLVEGLGQVLPREIVPFAALGAIAFAWVSTNATWGWSRAIALRLFPATRWPKLYTNEPGQLSAAAWRGMFYFLIGLHWIEFQESRRSRTS